MKFIKGAVFALFLILIAGMAVQAAAQPARDSVQITLASGVAGEITEKTVSCGKVQLTFFSDNTLFAPGVRGERGKLIFEGGIELTVTVQNLDGGIKYTATSVGCTFN